MSRRLALVVGVFILVLFLLVAVSRRVLTKHPQPLRSRASPSQAMAELSEVRSVDAASPPGSAEPGSDGAKPRERRQKEARKTYSVRLEQLETYCWGDPRNPSRAYAYEPVDMFALRIPTRALQATPFDFCIVEVRFDDARLIWGKDGRVDGSLGLVGTWLPFSDAVTTWEQPRSGRSFEGSVEPGAPLCIKGTAPEVFADQYADYWGAAVGFEFRRSASGSRHGAYTPRFSTIQVTVVGDAIPALLTFALDRNAFREDNESWCAFVR